MHHGVAWAIVQRLLVDAPSVEDDDGSTSVTETQVTTENAASILQQINSIIR